VVSTLQPSTCYRCVSIAPACEWVCLCAVLLWLHHVQMVRDDLSTDINIKCAVAHTVSKNTHSVMELDLQVSCWLEYSSMHTMMSVASAGMHASG
jgi:hypothetical protein